MSPAGILFFFFVLLGLGAPISIFLASRETETETNEEEPQESPEDSDDEVEEQPPEETTTATTRSDPSGGEDSESPSEEDPDETGDDLEEDDEETENGSEKTFERSLESVDATDLRLKAYEGPVHDAKAQSDYDDLGDPDQPSEKLKDAVEWLVNANTEAIHQNEQRREYLSYLRRYLREPRAAGAEAVARTPWREEPPNMSRLIGERLLVMALGLSARGPVRMRAHQQAFLALLGNSWSDDELEQPLLYQAIGRLGLLTPTDTTSLDEQLTRRIPGRVLRKENPPLSETAHFHSLLFAVSTGEQYPFPRSEKGLSRLWHWDEHNPPLAEPEHLPAVLNTLWLHYLTGGDSSEAANDFGAMLGTWWNDKEPTGEYLDEKPLIWESILLAGWVLLGDQNIIWEQVTDRYESLDLQNERLHDVTDRVLEWVRAYGDSTERPEEAPDEDHRPPSDWIRPLASELIEEYSTPSFNYPTSWCEQLSTLEPPELEATG